VLAAVCAFAADTRGLSQQWDFRISVFFYGKRNRHGVIREWECKLKWELPYGNGMKWEMTFLAKFPQSTTVSVMSDDTKSVSTRA